ncbi:reverse transcriptase [Trichonephila clavipes]|nr:reverse transcriptase [Trichonephila clavipes]
MTNILLKLSLSIFNTAFPSKGLNIINFTSKKAGAIPDELTSCVLETIEQKYSANEWLHICTDDSYLPVTNGPGMGWFGWLDSWDVGRNTMNYNGDVSTICEATTQLLSAGLAPAKVVFIDSQCAILALISNKRNVTVLTLQCRAKIVELISYGWTVALQWIPSLVRIPVNEGAESSQAKVPLTLRIAKNIISTYIDKCTVMNQKSDLRNPWEALATVGPILRHLERIKLLPAYAYSPEMTFWEYTSTS